MGSVKGRQSGHNAKTGKYVRQFARTAANKRRNIMKHNMPWGPGNSMHPIAKAVRVQSTGAKKA